MMTGYRRTQWRPNWDKNLRWRVSILRRDKYTCQKCGVKSKKQLQVHHIKKRSEYPHLQYDINNGICLCRACHSSLKNDEESYERWCWMKINNKDTIVKIGKMLYEEKERENEKG